MSQNNDFELLLVKDKIKYWEVIGTTYSNAMAIEPDCSTLKATFLTIQQCKKMLSEGKTITVSKEIEYPEVQPHDIVIKQTDELEHAKKIALAEVCARIHQAIFAVNVIDLMNYLNNYICLLNAGYFITDANREDKYFEIIEASQECEEPTSLNDDATFEEEQAYAEKKQKYDNAQSNLVILEKYLNSYDKLTNIKHITDFLNQTRKNIEESTTIEDVEKYLNIYRSNLKNYKMVNY